MRAWSLLLLLALAACSATPPTPAPAPAKPVNREEQADWAVRALDPCVLLPSPGTLTSPHACELTLDHGQTMTVEVGGGINHFARYRSQLSEENGLRVYLSYQPAAGYRRVNCQLAVPLAPTRAIWLTVSGGADYRRACDIARPTMRSITAKLSGDVSALAAGHEPRTRWRACEPLDRVLGRAPADPTMDAIRDTRVGDPSQADDCEWGDYRFAGRRLTFTLGTVPDEGAPVQVGTVPARLTDYQGTCVLIWAPTGTTPLATLRGGCDGLTDVATKIQTLLGGPPPARTARTGKPRHSPRPVRRARRRPGLPDLRRAARGLPRAQAAPRARRRRGDPEGGRHAGRGGSRLHPAGRRDQVGHRPGRPGRLHRAPVPRDDRGPEPRLQVQARPGLEPVRMGPAQPADHHRRVPRDDGGPGYRPDAAHLR